MENITAKKFSKTNEYQHITNKIPFTAKYQSFSLEDFLHFKKKLKEYILATEMWLETTNEETKELCETAMRLVQILKWKDYKTLRL